MTWKEGSYSSWEWSDKTLLKPRHQILTVPDSRHRYCSADIYPEARLEFHSSLTHSDKILVGVRLAGMWSIGKEDQATIHSLMLKHMKSALVPLKCGSSERSGHVTAATEMLIDRHSPQCFFKSTACLTQGLFQWNLSKLIWLTE